MRLDELMTQPLLEMSYDRKKAEAVITGLEKPINDHLLKLICVGGTEIGHWQNELVDWLDEVAEIRLKPHDNAAPSVFYFRILFDEPFGGVGERNTARRLRRLARKGHTLIPEIDTAAVAARLRGFHRSFAAGCAAEQMTEEAIVAMVAEIASS